MVKVIKRSGKEEEFLEDKIYNSLINAGASEEVAKQIVKELKDWIKTEGFGKISTDDIRRFVFNRLRVLEPDVLESWQFYDRIFKGRITFSDGKILIIDKGHLYLGRKVKDMGNKGLDRSEEVKEILEELKEDMRYGLSPKIVNARLYALFMGVLRKKDMPKEEKMKSIELINNFRKEMGWKPYELKQPIY
jgi:hypothetical protein